MDKSICYICQASRPAGCNFEKRFYCDEHQDTFVPLCQTCFDDFDEDECVFCKKEGKKQKPIQQITEQQQEKQQEQQQQQEQQKDKQQDQQQILETQFSEKELKEYKEGDIRVAYILPGCTYLLGEKSLLMAVPPAANMRIMTYSSFELISGQKGEDVILQTGGIENFRDVMTGSVIAPTNICQKLIIKENEGNFVLEAEELAITLSINRYCHASKKIREGEVVIIGGQVNGKSCLDNCELIDLNKNEIKDIAKLNKKRSQCQVCIINNFVYVFGGFNDVQSQECTIERLPIDKLEKWELIELKNLKDFNYLTGCSIHNCLNNQDEVYILGGSNGLNSTNQISKFNAKDNSIKTIQKMNYGRGYGAVIHENNKKLSILGFNEEGTIYMESWFIEDNCVAGDPVEMKQYEQFVMPMLVLSKDNFVRLN